MVALWNTEHGQHASSAYTMMGETDLAVRSRTSVSEVFAHGKRKAVERNKKGTEGGPLCILDSVCASLPARSCSRNFCDGDHTTVHSITTRQFDC